MTYLRLLMALVVLAGCGVRERQSAPAGDSATAVSTPESSGAIIYRNKCSFCHQTNGLGVSRTYPPLAGSDRITGDPARLVRIILNGMRGPITIHGIRYDNSMPGWRTYLSPADVAAVGSYVRSSWGNKAPPITPGFADSVARATLARPDPITEAGK